MSHTYCNVLKFNSLPPVSLTVTVVLAIDTPLDPFVPYATVGIILSIFATIKSEVPLIFPASSEHLADTVVLFEVTITPVEYVFQVPPFVLYSLTTASNG